MEINAVLPLTWLGFEVIVKDNVSVLNWQTTNEQRTKDFIIQHSTNVAQWQDIGTRAAAGYSIGVRTYNFTHRTITKGINYYRVLQRDTDGRYTYSITRSVQYRGKSGAILLSGNPVITGSLSISVNTTKEMSLWSVDGKKIWHSKLAKGVYSINIQHVVNGMCLLRDGSATIKIIVAR